MCIAASICSLSCLKKSCYLFHKFEEYDVIKYMAWWQSGLMRKTRNLVPSGASVRIRPTSFHFLTIFCIQSVGLFKRGHNSDAGSVGGFHVFNLLIYARNLACLGGVIVADRPCEDLTMSLLSIQYSGLLFVNPCPLFKSLPQFCEISS